MDIYDNTLKIIEKYIGNDTTNNHLLNQICYKILKNYKGCYPSDKIPSLKNGECCIANLDKHNQPGSHWVAVVKENDKYYVYDSFGRKPKDILNKNWNSTEDDVEQHIKEMNCGQRSITALIIYENHGLKSYLNL